MQPKARRAAAAHMIAVLTLLLPAAAAAQGTLADVARDARVQVHLVRTGSLPRRLLEQPITGRFGGTESDHVLLVMPGGADTMRVPAASIRAIDVSRGKPTRWRAALRGATESAVVGAVTRGAWLAISQRSGEPRPLRGALESIPWNAASGAAFGLALPPERWRRVWRRD